MPGGELAILALLAVWSGVSCLAVLALRRVAAA
jgi:hypothetical protein